MTQAKAKLVWSITNFGFQKLGVNTIAQTITNHELNAVKSTFSSQAKENLQALKKILGEKPDSKYQPASGKIPFLLSFVGRKAILSLPTSHLTIANQDTFQIEICVDAKFCINENAENENGAIPKIRVTSADQLLLIKEGSLLSFSYGAVEVKVNSVSQKTEQSITLICVVEQGGTLRSGMEVHSKSIPRNLFPLLPEDAQSLDDRFDGLADFVIANGICNLDELLKIRKSFLGESSKGSHRHPSVTITKNILEAEGAVPPRFLLKLDSKAALDLLPSAIKYIDGIFLSRSELGLDLHPHDLPILQKELTHYCNKNARIVVVESELMSSMQTNINPTRAEVSDMANAAADGVDALVLSPEVTQGSYGNFVAQVSKETLQNSEAWEEKKWLAFEMKTIPSDDDAVTYGAIRIAEQADVKGIVCFTEGGYTAMKLSSMCTPIPIIALTCNKRIMRQINFLRSVQAVLLDDHLRMEEILSLTKEVLISNFDFKSGDKFVFVSLTASSIAARNSNFFTLQIID